MTEKLSFDAVVNIGRRETGQLQLRSVGNYHVLCRLVVADVFRAVRVIGPASPYGTPPVLDEFFGRLAQDFRGWDGPRAWRSEDGDLELVAVNDWIGIVQLRVTLTQETWTAAATIACAPEELGQTRDSLIPLVTQWTPPSATRELLLPPTNLRLWDDEPG